MTPPSRERIPTKCTKCRRINFVRKDYLKALHHLYWCKYCRPHWRAKTLEDRMKLSLVHRKYNLNEAFFTKIDNEEKAYWLGFLAGDGAITENKVRLTLAIQDKAHLKKFKKAIKWTGKDYYHQDTNGLEVCFRSYKIVTDLKRYQITFRKTFTVRFPNIPKSYERHFIRGVFDADGCISRARRTTYKKSGKTYTYNGGEFNIEGNKEFISDIQSRLVELGLPSNSTNYSGKNINRIRYGGINQLEIIFMYLYENANIFLKRKKKLFDDILKNYYCEINKREINLRPVQQWNKGKQLEFKDRLEFTVAKSLKKK